MSTKAKLDKLLETKEAIKKAIQIKGGDVGDVFDEYPVAIKNLKTGSFTVPAGMKFGYSTIEEFPEDWDWSEVEEQTSLANMFDGCENLKQLPKLRLQNIVYMNQAFNKCYNIKEIDTSEWNTQNLKLANGMFRYCSNLAKQPIFDTSNVTDMSEMFHSSSLKQIALDTSNVTNLNSTFNNCNKLQILSELSAEKLSSDGSSYGSPLTNCYVLRHFGGFKGLKKNMYCTDAYSLSYESLLNIINGLADGVSGKTLYLSQDCVNQLSDDDIAIATNKGWSISPARTITEPVVVTNLSIIPSNAYQITPKTYDFSQYTGSWVNGSTTLLKCNPYVFEADLSGTSDASGMFYNKNRLKYVNLTNTHNLTNTDSMFQSCNILESVPSFDTSNVTSMRKMFEGDKSLISIPQLDTSNATNMSEMFKDCTSITTVSSLDTSNATTIFALFQNCSSLVSVPSLDLSKADAPASLFSECTSLVHIPSLDISNATNINYMFSGCTSLTSIPQLNTSNVQLMTGLFQRCTSLTSIPQLDTINVTHMDYLLRNTNIETIDLSKWDTRKVRDATSMFSNSNVKNVILGDIPSMTAMNYMFSNTALLESVTMKGAAPIASQVSNMFQSTKPNGKFYYNPAYDYSKIIAALPETWTAIPLTE